MCGLLNFELENRTLQENCDEEQSRRKHVEINLGFFGLDFDPPT